MTTDRGRPDSARRIAALIGPSITAVIIVTGLVLAWQFGEPLQQFGAQLLLRYGQTSMDALLLLATAVSSTILALPVAGYCFIGVLLGYSVVRLAVVMAVGATLGSFVTLILGRYFADRPWTRNRFPGLTRHKWTHGKSRAYVTCALFLGTVSPVPCDVFYAACGAMRFPRVLFICTIIVARFIRYAYLGFGFAYLQNLP